MKHERVTVIFANETIEIDGVEKRIPLRLPVLLKLKRLEWYGRSQSGLIVFNNSHDIKFSNENIVRPFEERWHAEPEQPDVAKLKQYMDEMTVDPNDAEVRSTRRRWAEVEKRHANTFKPNALLQLLSDQEAIASKAAHQSEKEIRRNLLSALLEQDNKMQSRTPKIQKFAESLATTNAKSSYAIREEERRKLQEMAKKSP